MGKRKKVSKKDPDEIEAREIANNLKRIKEAESPETLQALKEETLKELKEDLKD